MQWPSAGQAKADDDDTVAGAAGPPITPVPGAYLRLGPDGTLGEGYIGGSLPTPMIAPTFDPASQACATS